MTYVKEQPARVTLSGDITGGSADMRRKAIGVTLAITALALTFPAVAPAHRTATREEKSAMIYGASGRYYHHLSVAEPRSVPLRCYVADISTVVRGSRWGAYSFSRYAAHHERLCRAGNGYVVSHKIGSTWYVLWEGAEGYPPVHPRFGLKGVPRAIAKDLASGLTEYGQPL
jgi:hypothetical protein